MVKKYLNFEKNKGIYMKQIHFAGPLIEKDDIKILINLYLMAFMIITKIF